LLCVFSICSSQPTKDNLYYFVCFFCSQREQGIRFPTWSPACLNNAITDARLE